MYKYKPIPLWLLWLNLIVLAFIILTFIDRFGDSIIQNLPFFSKETDQFLQFIQSDVGVIVVQAFMIMSIFIGFINFFYMALSFVWHDRDLE